MHIHSTYSDGTNSPAEIVALAAKHRLSTISLTDHDTMVGTKEVVRAGEEAEIEVIPGLELSVVHGGKPLHILGYCLDEDNEELQRVLKKIQQARDERNKVIIDKLVDLGIPVTMGELKELSRQGQAGRPHIGAMLVKHGVVKNINQAFQHYLKKGRCGYTARQEFEAEEAICQIKRAGGLAVLAHPVQFSSSVVVLSVLVRELVAAGLDGVEMYYPSQSPAFRKKLHKRIERYDLLYTGGSDYHGEVRPGSSVGVELAAELVEEMRRRIRERLEMKRSELSKV